MCARVHASSSVCVSKYKMCACVYAFQSVLCVQEHCVCVRVFQSLCVQLRYVCMCVCIYKCLCVQVRYVCVHVCVHLPVFACPPPPALFLFSFARCALPPVHAQAGVCYCTWSMLYVLVLILLSTEMVAACLHLTSRQLLA
jgi:hypothetical protein